MDKRSSSATSDLPSDAFTQAEEWHARLATSPEARSAPEFGAWLAARPENARAFQLTEDIRNVTQAVRDTPEMMSLRIEALAAAGTMRQQRRTTQWAVAAGTLIIIACAYLWVKPPFPTDGQLDTVYRTTGSERLVATLDDGSSLTLDANSSATVHYGRSRRDIKLLSGRALFDVARDPDRPFVVHTAGQTVTALGTQFSVWRRDSGIQVALVHGVVSVNSESGRPDGAIRLAPRQVLDLKGTLRQIRTVDNIQDMTSWHDGILMFDDLPLADAIENMNIYSHVRIVAEGDIDSVRISGSFSPGDSQSFARSISEYYGLKLRLQENVIILSCRRMSIPHARIR